MSSLSFTPLPEEAVLRQLPQQPVGTGEGMVKAAASPVTGAAMGPGTMSFTSLSVWLLLCLSVTVALVSGSGIVGQCLKSVVA